MKRQVTTATSDVDLGTDDGLFMARITAAVAAKESARKSARVRRKMQQNAEQGLPGGRASRPYGYESDKITINPGEAVIVREMVTRYIAGESARAIAEDLDARGTLAEECRATLPDKGPRSLRHPLARVWDRTVHELRIIKADPPNTAAHPPLRGAAAAESLRDSFATGPAVTPASYVADSSQAAASPPELYGMSLISDGAVFRSTSA